MAVAYDASSVSSLQSGTTAVTWSHTCTGDDRVLIVNAVTSNGNTGITGVTYNSVSMTLISEEINGTSGVYASLWYLIDPATGANDIVASTGSAIDKCGGAISVTGAGTPGANNKNSQNFDGGNAEINVNVATTSTGNGMIIDGAACQVYSTTVGASQTQRVNASFDGGGFYVMMSHESFTSGSNPDMTWDMGTSHRWRTIAVEIPELALASEDTMAFSANF